MKLLKNKRLLVYIFCFSLIYVSSAQYNDTLYYPFVERFTEGSLETNSWTKEGDNWAISDDNGSPAPSMRFNGLPIIEGIYSYSLTSTWISLEDTELFPGIYLSFNLKIEAVTSNINSKLIVEILDDNEWKTIDIIYQEETNNQKIKYNLNSFITENFIRLRFRMVGINTIPTDYWELDNILLYNNAIYPIEIEGTYYWADDSMGVMLEFENEQPMGPPPPMTWCYMDPWDPTGIGMNSGGSWSWAAKWFPEQLILDSFPLTAVGSYFGESQHDSIVLNIWRGEEGNIPEYSKNITNDIVTDKFNWIYIIPPFTIYDTSQLWVGYTVYNQQTESFPAGLRIQDAVNGMGNLFKFPNSMDWETLTDYPNGNWSIYLYYHSGVYKSLDGFNIYRRDDSDVDYQLIGMLDHVGQSYCTYFDNYPNVNFDQAYLYQVKTVYTNHYFDPPITYESIAGTAKNSEDDFVMVFVTRDNNIISSPENISLYPNPAINYLNICSNNQIVNLDIYDISMNLVLTKRAIYENKIMFEISGLKPGVYVVNIETEQKLTSKKFVIN